MKKKILLSLMCALGSTFVSIPRVARADADVDDNLNSLLRGELSAVETYRQALEKVGGEPQADKVRSMLEDHKVSVEKLRGAVVKIGATPSTDSSAWGAWAKTVTGSAKLFGDAAALRALREGEQHGLKEYQEALQNKNLPQETKNLIQGELLPKQSEHVATLDSIIKSM